MSTATSTTLDQFVQLKERKADLERELRRVKEEIAPLEATLLEEFAAEGVAGKRHAATGKLVSITRKVWARAAGGDKARACEALRAVGLGDYVAESFNTNSLSVLYREQLRERTEAGEHVALSDLLDPRLVGFIELTEDPALSVRG